MNHSFLYALGGVLPHRLSPQMHELYWSALLQNLAMAMLLLFEPIYLWQQGYGVRGIILFFTGVYVAYLVLMPLGAAYATRFGYEHSMGLSTVAQVAYYACLFLASTSVWFLFPAALLYALQKSFYWPAYHADFARYSDQSEEGREISGLSVALLGVYVIGPLLAGVLLAIGSWWLLFTVGCVIILLSNWPLLRTPEVFIPRSFPYLASFRRLFEPSLRRHLLGYLGFGEELVVLTLWPVFISVVVVSYVEIGAVVAGATLFTALVTLYVGKLTDEMNKRQVLHFSVITYTLSWLSRLAVSTPLFVFGVDAWSRLAKNIVAVPLTAITYERAKSRSIMDTVVACEMALVIGKLLACAVLLFIFSFTTAWNAAWLVAAAMTLLYLLL